MDGGIDWLAFGDCGLGLGKRPQSAEKEDVKNCFSNQSETTLERAVFCVCKP